MTYTIDIMIRGEKSGTYTAPGYFRCSNNCFKKFCKLKIFDEESIYENFDEDQKRRFDEGYNDIGLVNLWYYIRKIQKYDEDQIEEKYGGEYGCLCFVNYFKDLGDFIKDILEEEDDGTSYYITIS